MLAADLMAGLIFGGIGFVALVYGRKQGRWKAALLGVLLMAYPYFVSGPWLNYGIGIALTALLFTWKD